MIRKEKIEGLLGSDPDDVFLNYSYALELAKIGEEAQAKAAFLRVRTLDPDYVPGYFQEGQYLAGLDEIEAAQEILSAGIEVAKRVKDDHALAEMKEFLANL